MHATEEGRVRVALIVPSAAVESSHCSGLAGEELNGRV